MRLEKRARRVYTAKIPRTIRRAALRRGIPALRRGASQVKDLSMHDHSEYLNRILLSRVYDVAVETPLDEAVSL